MRFLSAWGAAIQAMALVTFVFAADSANSDIATNCKQRSIANEILSMEMSYLLPTDPRVLVVSATDARRAQGAVEQLTQDSGSLLRSPRFVLTYRVDDSSALSPRLYEDYDVIIVLDSQFLSDGKAKYSSLMFDEMRPSESVKLLFSLSDANTARFPISRKAFAQVTEDISLDKQRMLLEIVVAVVAVPETLKLGYMDYYFRIIKALAADEVLVQTRKDIINDCTIPILDGIYGPRP